MEKTWVVVADRSRARIFSLDGRGDTLDELKDLAHPEGRLGELEIASDKPGRTFDRFGYGHHAEEEETGPKAQEAIKFAKEIASELEAGRTSNGFNHLVFVAAPRFLGYLRDAVSEETRKRVTVEVQKNLTRATPEEIRGHLPERL